MSHQQYEDDKIVEAQRDQPNVEDDAVKGAAGVSLDQIYAGQVHGMNPEDRATLLKLAQQADPGLVPFSWRMIKFTLIALVICACSGDNGFDGTIMSSVNSMTQFQAHFGLPAGGSAKTGIVFGMYTIGQVCAFFPVSYLPDKIGRRWSMFLGNCTLVIGAIISAFATDQNMGMFIGGRFLTGLGCTTASTSAKSYLTEITSPVTRGRWVGLLNSFYYVGQLLASGIAIPFGLNPTDWAWRTPILLQVIPAVCNASFVLFLPESPRWLYAHGHKERAVQVLAKHHSRTMDVNSPLILLEIQEIEENISVDGADKRFWDFRALFKTFGDRYRFGLCVIVSIWGQLSGNGLITYFLPILLGQAGITDSNQQRVLNFVNSITSFIGALTGVSLVDFWGRRKLMLFSAFSCCIGMFLVAGLLSPAGATSSIRANAGISFIFLFMVFFSFGWTPLQALYPAEVLPFQNRVKGLALQGLVTSAVSCINTFGLPPALSSIGWQTYLIFGCWDVVGIITVWLFVVETRQLTLEDMDEIFKSKNPKKRSFQLAAEAQARVKADKEARRAQEV